MSLFDNAGNNLPLYNGKMRSKFAEGVLNANLACYMGNYLGISFVEDMWWNNLLGRKLGVKKSRSDICVSGSDARGQLGLYAKGIPEWRGVYGN